MKSTKPPRRGAQKSKMKTRYEHCPEWETEELFLSSKEDESQGLTIGFNSTEISELLTAAGHRKPWGAGGGMPCTNSSFRDNKDKWEVCGQQGQEIFLLAF